MIANLKSELSKYPADWALTPVNKKKPLRDNWQMAGIDRQQIATELQSGYINDKGKTIRWDGVGILTGELSGGIIAIDCDGAWPHQRLGEILEGDIPQTVAFASGKPDRAQYLFSIPEHHWAKIKTHKEGTAKETGQLEFRWSGCQSVLPPSSHPETKGYTWVNSPSEVPIAPIPEKVLNYLLARQEKPQEKPQLKLQPISSGFESAIDYPQNDLAEVEKAVAYCQVRIISKGTYDICRDWIWGLCCVVGTSEALRLAEAHTPSHGTWDVSKIIRDFNPAEISESAFWGHAIKQGYRSPKPQKKQPESTGKPVKDSKKDDSKKDDEEKNPSPLAVSKLLVADLFHEKIRFDASTKQYWRYDGRGVWVICSDEYIFGEVQGYLEKGCPKDFSTSYVANSIKFALRSILHEGWTEASSLQYLPFSNGVLELATNQLLPHSPDYGFTWQLPRDYSILANNWSSISDFLKTFCVGNTELGAIAIAYCNAVLKGRADLQKFLYLFGSGANGKGVFMNLLTMLIGKENTYSTTMTDLNENRFESSNLRGKRLVVMTDEDKRSGGFGVFKAATGGDRLRYERKNKDASTFIFTGMFVVAANSPTFVGESVYAIKRRKIDFPAMAKIAEADRRDLIPEFEADLPAFTTFLLSLRDDWVTTTLRAVAKVEAVANLAWEMAIREDSIAAFYDEFLVPGGVNDSLPCGELYKKYEAFCEASGLRAKSIVNFTPSLVDLCRDTLGFSVEKQHSMSGKVLKGIKNKGTSNSDQEQKSPQAKNWEDFLAELRASNPSCPSDSAQGNDSKPVMCPSFPVIPVISESERKTAEETASMTGMTTDDGYMTGSKPAQDKSYDGYDGLKDSTYLEKNNTDSQEENFNDLL